MTGIMERVFPVGSSLRVMDEYCASKFSPIPTAFIIGPVHSLKSAILMQVVWLHEKSFVVLFRLTDI